MPTFITFNSATRTFTIPSTTTDTYVGVYTMTVTGSLTNGQSSSFSFTVTVRHHCYPATIAAVASPALSYQINATAALYTLNAFSNTDSTCPITYSLYLNGTLYSAPTGAYTFTASAIVLQLYSTSIAHLGTSTLRLQGTNGYSTAVYTDFTVDITVSPCYYAVVIPQTIDSQLYLIRHPTLSTTLNAFLINDTSCPITYSLYIDGVLYSGPTTTTTFDASTLLFEVYTIDTLEAATHAIILEGANGIYGTQTLPFSLDI